MQNDIVLRYAANYSLKAWVSRCEMPHITV